MEWVGGLSGTETVEEVALEKRVRVQAKTAEEISALCIDLALSPVDKALKLLKGISIQRQRVYADLAKLAKQCPTETVEKIIPSIEPDLRKMDVRQVSLVAESLVTICKEKSLPEAKIQSTCLRIILDMHNTWEGRGESNLWFRCLVDCIPHLPKAAMMNEIVALITECSQHSQPVQKRMESATLIGIVAPRMTSDWLQQKALPLVRVLGQDLQGDVRATMAAAYDAVCRQVQVAVATSQLLPDLLELLADDEEGVSLAAFQSLVPLLEYFEPDTCRKRIMKPLMALFASSKTKAKSRPLTLATLSKQFGPFIYYGKEYIDKEELESLLAIYSWLATQECDGFERRTSQSSSDILHSDDDEANTLDDRTQCRFNCAYNLPAIAAVSGHSLFASCCLSTVRSLQLDECPQVRITLAKGLHEVVRLSSPETKPLLQVVIGLLKDDNAEVVQAVLETFPAMLKVFMVDSPTDKTIVSEVFVALQMLNKMSATGSDWRLHRDVILSWACLAQRFPEDIVYGKLAPALFSTLKTNHVLPVKVAAARAIGSYIIYSRRPSQRTELCNKILQNCARGESSSERSLFLDICRVFLEIFSSTLFKEYFFDAVINMGRDPISTVREKACRLLPELKSLLSLPTDRSKWQVMETLVQDMLVTEEVDSVAAQVRETRAELDRRPIRVQSAPTTRLDSSDRKKEEEEQSLMAGEDETDGGRKGSADIKKQKSGSGRKVSASKMSAGPPSPNTAGSSNRRISAPVVASSPGTASKSGRSTSTSSIGKATAGSSASGSSSAVTGSTGGGSHGNGSATNRQGGLNRTLSSSGGASLLAGSAGSVRAPSSPVARLKASSLKESSSRRGNSMSALDACGRADGTAKSSDSPGAARQVKLPAINAQLKQNARARALPAKTTSSSGITGTRKPTAPSLVLPPHIKNTRHS
eukprot:scpid20751/ scgid32515/ Serine/threonine-protein phosphatase 4 regulatory subunit 4